MRYWDCTFTSHQCKIKKPYSQLSLGVFPFALQSAFRVEPFLAHCLIPCSWFCVWQRLEAYFLVKYWWFFLNNQILKWLYAVITLIFFPFFFFPQSACRVLSPICVYFYCVLLLPYMTVAIGWQGWDLTHLKGELFRAEFKSGGLGSCLNKVMTQLISWCVLRFRHDALSFNSYTFQTLCCLVCNSETSY